MNEYINGCTYQKGVCDADYPHCECCEYYKPKRTNFSRIKNMNVEDMAELIMHYTNFGCSFCNGKQKCRCQSFKDCTKNIGKWLNQPVESEDK